MKKAIVRTISSALLFAGLALATEQTVLAAETAIAAKQIGTDSRPATDVHEMDIRDTSATETLHITVGHSTVLHGVSPLKRIFIGNPGVLQSFTAGPSEIVLTAKAPGISSLVIWDTVGQSRLYTVAADVDPDALRQTIREAFPASKISVEGHEGRIYLSGTVPTPELADAAVKMAAPYAKDVVSSLRVVMVHGKQVQLKLRIVEVDRTKLEQYGVNIAGPYGRTLFNTTTGQFPSTITSTAPTSTGTGTPSVSTVTASDMLNLFLYSTKLNVGATIRALEQKQILQVLAEPTLTSMSGQPAKFLSGGEFPFPIAQAGASGGAPVISISFRPYGVKVEFTPTVNDDGTIHLKVAPEVSTLDYTNAVTISGFVIPALSTRRAETDVEIRSGQSFALSGLLDHRTMESLSQIPGISKIPILGKLFVSRSYTHSVVELVVMVTATVVDPLSATEHPAEPAMVVPNLDDKMFDKDLEDEKIQHPKK